MQKLLLVSPLLDEFRQELIDQEYAPNRRISYLSALKKFASYAEKHRIVKFNIEVVKEYLSNEVKMDFTVPLLNQTSRVKTANRVMTMLCDYARIGRIARDRCVSIYDELTAADIKTLDEFTAFVENSGYAKATAIGATKNVKVFLRFLRHEGINLCDCSFETAADFLHLNAFHHKGSLENYRGALQKFSLFLLDKKTTTKDFAKGLPSPKTCKNARIPSVWKHDDVIKLLNTVDRGSPTGKRDYAILLLVTKLGLRASDVRNLKLENLLWDDNRIEITQCKTGKSLTLPLLQDVGWAIIDYLRYGRPQTDLPNVFVTHNMPTKEFKVTNSLDSMVKRYTHAAGLNFNVYTKSGLHSLRHTLASRLLQAKTPLPIISEVLGHTDPNAVEAYLKVDTEMLRRCALNPDEVFENV